MQLSHLFFPSSCSFALVVGDVGTAFQGVATLLAGYLPGIVTCVLVIIGYKYLVAMDDLQEQSKARKALEALVVGSILVTLAVTFGPELLAAFKK